MSQVPQHGPPPRESRSPVESTRTDATAQPDRRRHFGVEEELLLVDASTLDPLPAGEQVVSLRDGPYRSGHEITAEFQQEQVEVISPPVLSFDEQLQTIRVGRALAAAGAAQFGGRVVALPAAPTPLRPHMVPKPRFQRIREHFGVTAVEQLTCGFHVHVHVTSRAEAVAVIDRIRVWLPTLLALSANSPFWAGDDTGFASYRYQLWSRWPTSGPTDVFGSVEAYDQLRSGLLATGVPLDIGMIYFDARVSAKHPTVEVRIADVCLEAEHAAVIATLIRALVETSAREWAAGVEPNPASATLLRAWSWWASHQGVGGNLIDPATGVPAPASEVVYTLLEHVGPVLSEYGEEAAVAAGVTSIVQGHSGARRQREVYSSRQRLHDVVADALVATHHDAPAQALTE